MKIEKQNLENHEVKLNVELDKEEFAPYMNKAAKKIAGKQRIPGFRPGKAPANVVRNMFGELAIAQEAFDMFLEEKYSDILSEAEIEPGAMRSRLVPNLFFAGEMIDVDAHTGGFNLQIAWSTGALAGASSADHYEF